MIKYIIRYDTNEGYYLYLDYFKMIIDEDMKINLDYSYSSEGPLLIERQCAINIASVLNNHLKTDKFQAVPNHELITND